MVHKFPNWCRIIAHVDMDAFFASIEQRDFPELQARPLAITNGLQGTCVITRSYEARRWGVTTGMRLKIAQKICPDLIQRPARPAVYAEVSMQILEALETLTPDIEVFSVDEAFLEFTHCRELYDSIEEMGVAIKRCIWEVSGLTCSVGISGDKTTAKFAAKQNKPNGLMVVPPEKAEAALAKAPVTDLCGVAKGIGRFLAQHGVYRCGDMKKIPISVLGRRFGNVGRRIWAMAQGKDSDPLHQMVADPKSMGHGKIMPPNTRDRATLLFFLNHMSEKLAVRLRKHQLQAQWFFVGLRTDDDWLAIRCRSVSPTYDGHCIYAMARQLVETGWDGEGVHQCQITALDPKPASLQGDFFVATDERQNRIHRIVDAVNERFGPETLTNGIRMEHLKMPDVIAPAWRPEGHRANIILKKK